jgi:hypothetical protein
MKITQDIVGKTTHRIKLKDDAIPVVERMCRVNPERQDLYDETVKDLLNRGLIEPGNGEWRSRMCMVKKKDGGWRTTIDYKKVNEMIKVDKYPVPRIDDMLDRLNGARYFSKLDLVDGFWQVRLDDKSKEITGFANRGGFYQWKVLPMGLVNSPSVFQRNMDVVLGDLLWTCAMMYMDDCIIFSRTFEEHLNHLELVIERFEKANLYVKLSKCEFGMEKIDFLGFEISSEGVHPNQKKIEAIVAMSRPKDVKALHRFLGMSGFYRRYIQNYASRTLNMRELLQIKTKWEWKERHQKEFEDLKQCLTSAPVMAFPDFSKKFVLATDASLQGLGAILSQEYPNGNRVIAYASRSLNVHEKNYGITQLEALGVVWGVEQFKTYLMDQPFDLITDHKALESFKKIKVGNPMLER